MELNDCRNERKHNVNKLSVLSSDNRGICNSALKVLFLSSDTGGGHRASAESLARQFELLYPGTTYELLDVMEKDAVHPYNKLVSSYKHLSAHPSQWKFIYNISNSRAFELFFDVHNNLTCEKAIRKSIMASDPDVVISVHPMMTNVPVASCAKINKKTGRHLPIFTVVTDLGSAHCLWFASGVDKMFIATDQIRALAKVRGKINDEKIVKIGLPIRHQFSVQSDLLGDRMSDNGIEYQKKIRKSLDLPFVDRKTILLIGGGEGVGLISNIVDSLYVEHVNKGIDAIILVVCGRNEKLKNDLAKRDWNEILKKNQILKCYRSCHFSGFSFSNCVDGPYGIPGISSIRSSTTKHNGQSGCIDGYVTQNLRRILSTSTLSNENNIPKSKSFSSLLDYLKSEKIIKTDSNGSSSLQGLKDKFIKESKESFHSQFPVNRKYVPMKNKTSLIVDQHCRIPDDKKSLQNSGNVSVISLGFVTNMADYMVAADVLVSKAGPGTIAEAASLSLPVLLTSFLPGQEEGNVNFVVYGGFGSFISDSDPDGVAEEVAYWLTDHSKLEELSKAAKAHGAPNAARDIVRHIGDLTLKWKQLNNDRDRLEKEAEFLRNGELLINNI